VPVPVPEALEGEAFEGEALETRRLRLSKPRQKEIKNTNEIAACPL